MVCASRYLLVSSYAEDDTPIQPFVCEPPVIPMDPRHPLTVGTNQVKIPQSTYRLQKLLGERLKEYVDEDYDEEDSKVFASEAVPGASLAPHSRLSDDWVHDPEWVTTCVEFRLPAPVDASPLATASLQRELTAMLKEQERAKSYKELGWYMPPECIGDNLFQWIVEMHSFDPDLPVAQDMKAK